MPTFGERLRFLRTCKELSQMDLAKQIKVSKSSVNMYERNEREPSFATLEYIADYFNVDLDYLLGKSEYANKFEWLKGILSGNLVPAKESPEMVKILRIASRDGTFAEYTLTNDQIAIIEAYLDSLHDVKDGL